MVRLERIPYENYLTFSLNCTRVPTKNATAKGVQHQQRGEKKLQGTAGEGDDRRPKCAVGLKRIWLLLTVSIRFSRRGLKNTEQQHPAKTPT